MRITAGWSSEEIAEEFNRRPPPFRFAPLPKNTTFTSGSVNSRLRTLRNEMVDSVDPTDRR